MTAKKRYLFVIYDSRDLNRVKPLVSAFREELASRLLPVEIWIDVEDLHPGDAWEPAIFQALESSIGFIFFLSAYSLESRFVLEELEIATAKADGLIIPVILQEQLDLPSELELSHLVDLSGEESAEKIWSAADQIADATESYLGLTTNPEAAFSESDATLLAADIAQGVRSANEPSSEEIQQNSVFVVHGHNTEALAQLEQYLASVGVTPVILARLEESPQSLFQKFMSVANKARFAIVLLTADDYGASLLQYEAEGVADRALQFRARQNVILELGFFYGRLGWENVFVVHKKPDPSFPNYERPSDLDGVVFDSMSDSAWQDKLSAKLVAAGFKLLEDG